MSGGGHSHSEFQMVENANDNGGDNFVIVLNGILLSSARHGCASVDHMVCAHRRHHAATFAIVLWQHNDDPLIVNSADDARCTVVVLV